jgi:hypothetical protein
MFQPVMERSGHIQFTNLCALVLTRFSVLVYMELVLVCACYTMLTALVLNRHLFVQAVRCLPPLQDEVRRDVERAEQRAAAARSAGGDADHGTTAEAGVSGHQRESTAFGVRDEQPIAVVRGLLIDLLGATRPFATERLLVAPQPCEVQRRSHRKA